MGMTVWRWTAGVAIGCAAVATILLPFPPTVAETWKSAAPTPLADGLTTLMRAAGQAHAAVRDYRAARGLDRWKAAKPDGDTALVRVARDVPPSVAAQARAIALEQWAALATPVSAQHAEVFVYLDSTSIPRADDEPTTRRWLEPRQFVDVTYALPGATGSRQCVALVRLRGVTSAHINALRNQALIGICGFYAAFGLPGDSVQAWLARSNYRFAKRSDWSIARAPATDAAAVYGLSDLGVGCLTGGTGACRKALRLEPPDVTRESQVRSRLAWVIDEAQPAGINAPALLGDANDEWLADAVRSLGAERFARFWSSTSAPDIAFLEAAGIAIEPWTQRWLTRVYGALPPRPRARMSDLLWLSFALTVGLFVARRPRERVLA